MTRRRSKPFIMPAAPREGDAIRRMVREQAIAKSRVLYDAKSRDMRRSRRRFSKASGPVWLMPKGTLTELGSDRMRAASFIKARRRQSTSGI